MPGYRRYQYKNSLDRKCLFGGKIIIYQTLRIKRYKWDKRKTREKEIASFPVFSFRKTNAPKIFGISGQI